MRSIKWERERNRYRDERHGKRKRYRERLGERKKLIHSNLNTSFQTPSSFADYDDYDSNLDPAPIIAATPPPTFRPTYPPTYPPTWYSQYRPTYPPTWPPQYRPVYPPTYPPANSRSWNARPPPPPPPERFRPVRRTISAPQTVKNFLRWSCLWSKCSVLKFK